ncbi:MAG TPA: transporter [Longimicrobiaceae bacterium]|nr:transporter [Longimicrobiaceae bacterium]
MTAVLPVLVYALIPVVMTAIGAALAALRPPGAQLRSAVQHFAAGVVFSVVAVELLPDVARTHEYTEVAGGFAAGVVLMLVLRRFTEKPESSGSPVTMLAAVSVDLLIDGILVGIAFAAGEKEGILLSVALGLELLSLGLALSFDLARAGLSRLRAAVVPVALAAGALLAGTFAGVLLLVDASPHLLATVLSFGCAALLFLVTEELLVEAHEVPESTATTAMFFAGFLLFLLLGMVAP